MWSSTTNKIICIITLLLASSGWCTQVSDMILRLRQKDGSIQRIHVSGEDDPTLSQILQQHGILKVDEEDNAKLVYLESISSSPSSLDVTKTMSELGLQHGSLLRIQDKDSETKPMQRKPKTTTTSPEERFDPFPDLAKAKSFSTSLRRAKALKKRGMSYGDYQHLTSSYMHTLETQPKGTVERIYMCRICAERFATLSPGKKKKQPKKNRVALLFGKVSRERLDISDKKKKVKTSLSSTTETEEMCDVVKVHAMWEPPRRDISPDESDVDYNDDDISSLFNTYNDSISNVCGLASRLGLCTIGWIFSHAGSLRSQDSNLEIPHMTCTDIYNAASLQNQNMKYWGREKEGKSFVTLSLDHETGATEAFQISDVTVQMLSENVFQKPASNKDNRRYLSTKDPVMVNGKESQEIDSVLCLINTAMIPHVGHFSGDGSLSVNKKGALTSKTKKKLLSKLESNEDAELLEYLSDFNVLLALDALLSRDQMKELCDAVCKFTRGRKKNTTLGKDLKLILQSVFSA